MHESIVQHGEKRCYICGKTVGLERHHVFYGTANRAKSDKDGCWVYLCVEHHRGDTGVHKNYFCSLALKKKVQKIWMEKNGSVKDFIKRYGRNYL